MHVAKISSKTWADPEGGGGTGSPPPLKNHINKGFLCNTSLYPLKNHVASKPVFKIGPYLAASETLFQWCFTGGQMMAHL